MQTKYRIDVDPQRQLVHLRLLGQWDRPTLTAYRQELRNAMQTFAAQGARPGEYLLLIDVREHGVQPKEVAAEHQEIIAEYIPLARRRALVMSASALHALQVRRISPTPDVDMFRTDEEALAWLLA